MANKEILSVQSLNDIYKNRGLSWYSNGDFDLETMMYFRMIEQTFRVQHADGEWRFIKLQPHQQMFHSLDIALKRGKSKHTVDIKSRNTSFTVDSILRLLTGNYYYHDEVVPIVRINENKVKEIIKEIKSIIRHMRPIKMSDGSLFPFNPERVTYSAMSIEFEDIGVVFQGYTSASPDSAENIRGVRTTRGLLDETNFFSYWGSILGAMKGANRGVDMEGNMHFQITIGTTLRGFTEFLEWFINIKNKAELKDEYDILEFPVFDPKLFDDNVPPDKQPGLIPIVFWHSIKKLTSEWHEDKDKFMEEYMAVVAPSEGAYFPMDKVINASTEENVYLEEYREFAKGFAKDSYNVIGVDPSGEGTDYFSIAVTNHDILNKKTRTFHVFNEQRVSDPNQMVNYIKDLYKVFNARKIRIDGNDLGYFIATALKNEYGAATVEIMRGNTRVKSHDVNIPLKEFMLTNIKKGLLTSTHTIVNDELIMEHFKMWKNDYSCDRSAKYGHGDSVVAIGLSMLPMNWRFGKTETITYDFGLQNKDENPDKGFYTDMKERMKFYKKNNSSTGGFKNFYYE